LAVLILVSANFGSSMNSKADDLQTRYEQKGQIEYVYQSESPFRALRLAQARKSVSGMVSSPKDVPLPGQIGSTNWVVDMTGVLHKSTISRINSMSQKVRRQTGGEVVVVTVPRVKGASSDRKEVKAFATKLFNYWGIGERNKNNGVLILVSVGDRRVEVEIGSGLNYLFNEEQWLQNMVDKSIIPPLRQNRWDQGVLAGASKACAKLRKIDSRLSVGSGYRKLAFLAWGASGVAKIRLMYELVSFLFFCVRFSQTPRCSLCGQRTSRLRDAMMAELEPGQQAEVTVGSVRHVLCGCCRPSCRKTWAVPADLRTQTPDLASGGARIGARIRRTREVALEEDEVVEAARQRKGLAIYSEVRRLSGYTKCPSCSYRTARIVSETMVQPTTTSAGLAIEVTDCAHCGARDVRETVLSRIETSSYDSGGGSSDGGGAGGDF